MFPVSLFLLLLGIFLYMDRFLFKGALARLFIEGWGQILHRKKSAGRRGICFGGSGVWRETDTLQRVH